MKRTPVVLVSALLISFAFFLSCTKIDTTSLGAELIPPVDNIHTFEMNLDLETDNKLLSDSTRMLSTDDLPVGYTNDPDFGQTQANFYFDVSIPTAGNYPYGSKDSLTADSVILSLDYRGVYGDSNSTQTLRVFEMSQTSGFRGDSLYRLDQPDFATTGAELGNKTFVVNTLNDSVTVIRKDTIQLVNVLRIKLDNALATRLMSYDTSYSANGGYNSDSLFKTLFRGFAIKADPTGNALTYFKISDTSTKLIVYYHHGHTDTSFVEYSHSYAGISNPAGVADAFKRMPGGGWNTYLTNAGTDDDLLYIPSTPGSYGSVHVKGLDTMSNKVIHLAELIFPVVPSASQDVFTPQGQLFLDMVNNTKDSIFTIQNDFLITSFGYNFDLFGGILKSYTGAQQYRFNISRHIQGVITRHEPIFDMRVYAPFETNVWYLSPGTLFKRTATIANIPIVPQVGRARVVVGGGSNANPNYKARLRIIYSNI